MNSQDIGNILNQLERKYFFERKTGKATGTGYIAADTWRAWRASPKTEGAVSKVLISAFDFLIWRFEKFFKKTQSLDRIKFDAFHREETKALYQYSKSFHKGIIVHPAASGSFYGYAYNSFAKVLNLAYTHWCFRPNHISKKIQYEPALHPGLLFCLHVPLDNKVLKIIGELVSDACLPTSSVHIPNGGMGSIKSKEHYYEIQNYLRTVADKVPSKNFLGKTVSPLAFEALWGN